MKKITSIIMALCLLCLLTMPALADDPPLQGKGDWTVTFTGTGTTGKMNDNFKERQTDMDDALSAMQPGDRAEFTITLENQHEATTRWYMRNDILQSLEDYSANSDTHGGAYSYLLEFNGPSGAKTLFDSETVGGEKDYDEGEEGLNEATNALDEYFELDTLASGDTAVITLTVGLDGETQGNDYQDTMAQLSMMFAVELDASAATPTPAPTPTATPQPGSTPAPTPTPGTTTTTTSSGGGSSTTVVKTGDEMRLMPFYIGMVVSGVLFLALAVDSIRRRRKEDRDE